MPPRGWVKGEDGVFRRPDGQPESKSPKGKIGRPPLPELGSIKVGEFFIYKKCLWFRSADSELLGSKIKQYERLSNEDGIFQSDILNGVPGAAFKLLDDEVKVQPLQAILHRNG